MPENNAATRSDMTAKQAKDKIIQNSFGCTKLGKPDSRGCSTCSMPENNAVMLLDGAATAKQARTRSSRIRLDVQKLGKSDS